MSHTLHRCGAAEDLKQDFVVFSMSAKTVNAKGSGETMKRFFELLRNLPAANFGDVKTGSRFNTDWQTIHDRFRDQSVAHYVFSDRHVVAQALRALKDADLGLSVIVSGVFAEIEAICREVGLPVHTVQYSGGVLGRTDRLPPGPVLAITTMCGHGLVSARLVEKLARQVKRGQKEAAAAAAELARPCMCGVFNVERAERLLRELADRREG